MPGIRTRQARARGASPPRLVGQLIAGLGALAVLAALLAGPPLLAAAVVRLQGLPTLDTFTLLGGRLTDTAFIFLLAGVMLLAWARFLACVVVEAAGAIWRRAPRRIPLIAEAEQVVARRLITLVVGVVTAVGTLTVPTATASPARADVIAAAPADPQPSVGARADGGAVPVAAVVGARAAIEQASTEGLKRYVVRQPRDHRHDSLWAIAERHLGDGLRWKEIYALNKDRPQADGRKLEFARLIRPGWALLLPADAIGAGEATPSRR